MHVVEVRSLVCSGRGKGEGERGEGEGERGEGEGSGKSPQFKKQPTNPRGNWCVYLLHPTTGCSSKS